MANVNLSKQDMDYIARVVATEVPASLQRTAPDQYKAMVEAVVDTITNRVASTGFPDTVEAVVNQDRQFSKIAGPSNLNPYGSVKNAPKASSELQKMVENHLVQRANGKPSTIGNSVNYANPNYSTANNLGWIADMANMGGVTLGVGDAIHIHGNAPGAKVPDNYTLSVPGAIGNPSQMDSKNIGFSPSRNLGTPRMDPGFAQGRTFRNTDGSVFTTPQRGNAARLADQLGQYRQSLGAPPQPRNVPVPQTAPRPSQTITPNKVNTFTFSPIDPARFEFAPNRPVDQSQRFAPMPANVDPARFSPQASLAELANQYSQYQRGTPATAPTDIAPSRPTANVDPARFSPPVSTAQLANQYSQYQRGTVPAPVSAPAQTASIDPARFDNISAPQPNMTPNDVRHSYHNGLAGVLNPPSFAPGPTTSQSVRDAQAGLAKSNQRDQFARDILKGIEVEIGPPSYNVDRGRFGPGPSNAELANQYSQYGNRVSAPTAPQSANVFDMIDIPQSATIADQYRSYGAGKIAPQVASTATQASPAVPNVAVPGPIGTTPQSITDAAKSRFDAAKPGVYQGIPPSDIYDQSAPGRSGFRGFGAGGFLGNLLTGNIGNMQGIDRSGGRGINVLGAIIGAALGGVPGAAIGALGPAIMGGIGRGGEGNSPTGDGGLSPGAAAAGWTSNNPERTYGGYGSGYDPTPV